MNEKPSIEEMKKSLESGHRPEENRENVQIHPLREETMNKAVEFPSHKGLVDAMAVFVMAQHEYINTQDVVPMIGAQKVFMAKASDFLEARVAGYVAEANELAINRMLDAIRKIGLD